MKYSKNHIQMQQGLSLEEFEARYGTEKKCIKTIEKIKWSRGHECPRCGGKSFYKVRNDRLTVYQCKKCHSQSTLLAGTIFEQTKLPLTKWFQAIYFITQAKNGISILELRRLLGVSYSTAWRLHHKLQQVMLEREENHKLHRRVEIDDAYLGGANPGGKAGRGSENKVPFVAAVETDDKGHPIYMVLSPVKAFTKQDIKMWADKHLGKTAQIVSDGYKCFNVLADLGLDHRPEVVGTDRKSTSLDCFKWVNTILANIKTAFMGTYHSFKFKKYAGRYLAEVQYRFNRRFDLRTLPVRLATACMKTGSRPEKFLRLAEG